MLISFMSQLDCLAYVGPGAGLSMLGTLAAVVGVLLLAILAPIVYAVQLAWGLVRGKRSSQSTGR